MRWYWMTLQAGGRSRDISYLIRNIRTALGTQDTFEYDSTPLKIKAYISRMGKGNAQHVLIILECRTKKTQYDSRGYPSLF